MVPVAIEAGQGAPRAEENIWVTIRHEVFRRRDKFVNRGHRPPPLQEDGDAVLAGRPAYRPEKRVVQCVARTNLDSVQLCLHRELQMLNLHHLSDDGEASLRSGFEQDVERPGRLERSVAMSLVSKRHRGSYAPLLL